MNTEPLDYEGRKGLQETQQEQRSVVKSEPVKQPESPKQDEKPLTRSEVQGLVNSLVESIVKGFAQKGDIDALRRAFYQTQQEFKRNIPTKKQITDWATECVPPSLRGLDSDPTRKLGDTLKMVSGYPVGSDKVMCVNEEAELPVGTALLPHLQWNAVTSKWEIALISGTYDVSWCFSMKSISSFTATFYGGPVIKGTTLVGTVAETPVTISATGQIVYMVYTMASGEASFGVANADNFPASASGTYVKALQSFTKNATTIIPLLTYHRGVVQIDGVYA